VLVALELREKSAGGMGLEEVFSHGALPMSLCYYCVIYYNV
jgi:hypothetical protein